MRPILAVLLAVLPAWGGRSAGAQDPAAPARPNVVLFLADDLGWRDLACTGHSVHETPAVDRLAAEGVRFTQAYANAPNCAPSRAALMSGLYAPRTGIYTVGSAARGRAENRKLVPTENRTDLDESFVSLAEAFSAAGYRTAHVGKWHLGDDPAAHGFDLNVGGTAAGHPKGYRSPYRNAALADGPEGEYLTDRLAREAAAFVRAEDPRPFFLYFPFYAVHTPIQGRADLVEHFRARAEAEGDAFDGVKPGYAAMVTALDEAVGVVLDALDEHELADDTIVVFFSDNGGHGKQTSMAPLRGSKGMLYEGGIREPLIVRWPGRFPAGALRDEPVLGFDLYPTLLAAASVPLPAGAVPEGVGLVESITTGAATGREELYWHFPAYLEAYDRSGGPWRTTPAGAIRVGRWKLIEFFEDDRVELYDLVADPGEATDLSRVRPEKRDDLLGRLARWRERTDAPVPTELEPAYRGD